MSTLLQFVHGKNVRHERGQPHIRQCRNRARQSEKEMARDVTDRRQVRDRDPDGKGAPEL